MPRLDRRRVNLEAEVRELGRQVMDLRMQGRNRNDIAEILGISQCSVHRHIKEQIQAIRMNTEELAEEMFLLHQERLEELYALVKQELDKMEGFDDKPFKLLIVILERQAKLLGLDVTPARGERNAPKGSWLDDATPHELIAEVESYGFHVDERFKLPFTPTDARRARNDKGVLAPGATVGATPEPEERA